MKILAIDIGAGTQDLILYDDRKISVENCVKMVLPCASQVFAAKVREKTRLHKDIFVKGEIIGGGAFVMALKNQLEMGHRVVMTEKSAYTVRNNLDEVRKLGIETVTGVIRPNNFKGETITLEEVNFYKLQEFLLEFDETFFDIDVVAVAVQDHGVSVKGLSNRRFRIQKMKNLLNENPNPETLAFPEEKIPPCFLRMKSMALTSRKQLLKAKILLMDTAPAAILGCLKDPFVAKADPILAINLGNGHTMAAIISKGRIVGIMEHHTQLLNPQKIEWLLPAFADGKLSNEKVFREGGHGLFFLTETPSFSKIEVVAATGPNRGILAKTRLSVHYAAPGGDVMMTGPMGLIEATKRKLK